jgi:Beta-ketoacyl synthase, N-terminal domain
VLDFRLSKEVAIDENVGRPIKFTMNRPCIRFSVFSFAAWAPGIETGDAWLAWAKGKHPIGGTSQPAVRAMAPLMRRRAGFLGKMALEVAYQCLGDQRDVPAVFCSRHGEAARSVDLLLDLANFVALSPTSFSLSVHNATAGLFSIARGDHSNSIALAAGQSTVEHGVIEACGLLADGEPQVLLVVYDCPLPTVYHAFQDCCEQPFAWSWLMRPPANEVISLSWSRFLGNRSADNGRFPGGLEILRFFLRKDACFERTCDGRRWHWSQNAH